MLFYFLHGFSFGDSPAGPPFHSSPLGRAAERMTGYMHPQYAKSFEEVANPRALPGCQGWILERPIAGFPDRDAMGCYPLFSCPQWSRLHEDLHDLAAEQNLVSMTMVTDPFGDYDAAYLRRCFPDLAVPFKEHYVIDLTRPVGDTVSKHHRKEARRALKRVSVQSHPNPPEFLDEWMALHQNLVVRHNIQGIKAFSRRAFETQFSTPGMDVLTVTHSDETLAAMLYFVQGEVAYGHVLACTDLGYRMSALYAGLWFALEHFAGTARWIDLMGVPGLRDAGSDRIREFKLGWTGETRMSWLCGRILDQARYREISKATGKSQVTYFPAYREGEMV